MKWIRFLLLPVAILYDAVTSVRNALFSAGLIKSTSFSKPIILVGNLSVGGTGKTPQIEYLIRLLQNHYKLAVLSRGYGRKTNGFLRATKHSTAREIGDEPLQFFKKFKGLQVAVDEQRVHGVNQLLTAKNAPEVILLDDAFQHRKIKAGFSILLTKYNDLFVNDFLLPTGNLRESRSGAFRADLIVVSKCPNSINTEEQTRIKQRIAKYSKAPVFFSYISYASHIRNKAGREIPVTDLKGYELLLITGIANPNPLLKFLTSKDCSYKHVNFPDHHVFSEREIKQLKTTFKEISADKKVVLATEKDAMRLSDKMEDVYFLEIETQLLGQQETFDAQILEYCKNAL